jgi:hypothetical protein
VNDESFLQWVRRGLVPHLRRGDIVLLDNLKSHKQPMALVQLFSNELLARELAFRGRDRASQAPLQSQ